jgi:hypothetical protein
MEKFHKEMKSVKKNTLRDDNEKELGRIRKFANMESATPEHFDAQTYEFDSPSAIKPDLKRKSPFAKSTKGTEEDDTHHLKNKNISFPVRAKVKD